MLFALRTAFLFSFNLLIFNYADFKWPENLPKRGGSDPGHGGGGTLLEDPQTPQRGGKSAYTVTQTALFRNPVSIPCAFVVSVPLLYNPIANTSPLFPYISLPAHVSLPSVSIAALNQTFHLTCYSSNFCFFQTVLNSHLVF